MRLKTLKLRGMTKYIAVLWNYATEMTNKLGGLHYGKNRVGIISQICIVVPMLLVSISCETQEIQSMVASSDHATCQSMKDQSYIPKGWHPVTVQWRPQDPNNDMVCIAKTEGKQIQVVAWKGFSLPPNYYVLYSDATLNDRFRGCSQWSEFQGRRTCMNSWVMSMMQINP